MTNEEATFAAYRARPDRKNLVRLLEANQHRVYNLCWHVLQQREDAEDASQQILVKILEGAGALPDARQFSLWLYRVTLNCALDVRRARARRGKLQERASGMKNHDPQTVRLYEAVHDALAKLDDEIRCLIVRHHFEKRTLEELACEERCSAVAIWKRIEKGKQLLKDALATAGWASVAAPVASYWDSLTPVHAPGGLVAKALAAKTAMGAAALGGGMVMATKGVMSATMLGAAI
ncbi:MAG: sigma-70 family RNA polymerase sigma factor, partial [Planctomycetes bacterium]|nr:sigma-70 family RNA polymerase sigma factor [Planctomycetota bacterium]